MEVVRRSSSIFCSDWAGFCWGGAVGGGDTATNFLGVLMTSFLIPEWGVWLFVILPGVLKDRMDCTGDLVAVLRAGIFYLGASLKLWGLRGR